MSVQVLTSQELVNLAPGLHEGGTLMTFIKDQIWSDQGLRVRETSSVADVAVVIPEQGSHRRGNPQLAGNG